MHWKTINPDSTLTLAEDGKGAYLPLSNLDFIHRIIADPRLNEDKFHTLVKDLRCYNKPIEKSTLYDTPGTIYEILASSGAESMGRLYLLMQSYRNMDSLPEEWKDEIRTQIGYPQSKEHVLSGEPVADSWLVLHKQSRKVNDVNTDIYWFYGKESGLFAKYLSFAVAGTFSTENWIPGSVYKGTLCFYNGTGTCRRALFRESVLAEESFVPTCSPDLKQAAAVYRTAMLTNPFAEYIPLLVDGVTIARNGKDYTLLDNAGNAVRVAMPEETFIDILAITGGNPFASLVIINGDIWELKSIWYNKEYHTWRDERN